MMDFYEHIEQYISGDLTPKERKDMELAILADKKLAEAVDNHQLVMMVLDAQIEKEVRNITDNEDDWIEDDLQKVNLKGSEAQKQKPESTSKTSVYFRVILAVFIVAILVTLYMMDRSKDVKHQQMLASYELPMNQGSRGIEVGATSLDSAIYYFDRRDFDKSRLVLDRIASTTVNNDQVARYKAHLAFLDRSYEEALHYIDEIDSLRESDIKLQELIKKN